MAFSVNFLQPPSPRTPTSPRVADYDSSSSTDSEVTSRLHGTRSRAQYVPSSSATGSIGTPRSVFLFPPAFPSGRSSLSSTATNTPLPSRSTSPLPHFYSLNPSSSCASDTDSDSNSTSPLTRTGNNANRWWRERRGSWWGVSRRRRKRNTRMIRTVKKLLRRLLRHPFCPGQPITIVLTSILFSIFAISLTLLLIYVLNPDKEPLPWRAYCAFPSMPTSYESTTSYTPYSHSNASSATGVPPFPPSNLDVLPPAGLFIGVFSIDSAFERRMLVRSTWASHPRSRDGSAGGDHGVGTSRSIVRFILGQPSKDWERRINLEMEMYNDIVILPIQENMNRGKTHTFFSWASINAWVPPLYLPSTVPPPQFSYSNHTNTPPPLAPHDPSQAWEDEHSGEAKAWVRPDYIVKVDDDSFVMLAELESRLRLELHTKQLPIDDKTPHHDTPATENVNNMYSSLSKGFNHSSTSELESATTAKPVGMLRSRIPVSTYDNDPMVYWGYFVSNRLHEFMAGELYALSWSLVDWVAKEPAIKTLTKGAEDKQTAKWMRLHPRASEIRWVSERCWIYDHPRSGTVYSHGYLFPSEVSRIKSSMQAYFESPAQAVFSDPVSSVGSHSPTPAAWAHSSVSTFNVRYVPPLPDLSTAHSVEALVEGSDMSKLREGSLMTPEYAWIHREGRRKRYEGKRVGGTVVVHFIKKNMWFLETALALLEGEELSESERYEYFNNMERLERRPVHPTHSAPKTTTNHTRPL